MKLQTRDLVRIAIAAALTAVCAWITVPLPGLVPFTMQTFAVLFALGFLGGKCGTLAVTIYLLLGAVGAPVFSSFGGGLGKLLGPTGGYLFGFLLTALVYWLVTAKLGKGLWSMALAMVLGLLTCYAVGTAWFCLRYAGDASFVSALGTCVVPFLLPDALKLALALSITRALRRVPSLR